VTSLWWDLARAVGNVLLLLLLAAPMLRLLRRFERRFHFTAVPYRREVKHGGQP
jgi:energy-coupling factor transport system substrate-specific component